MQKYLPTFNIKRSSDFIYVSTLIVTTLNVKYKYLETDNSDKAVN